MTKTNTKGRAYGEEKHVRLHRWVMRSEAYRSLSCVARCLLLELYNVYNGSNNGEVFLSCRDAAGLLGLSSKDTASRAFSDLKDRGFIRVRGRSSFTMKNKIATTWVLTEFPFAGALPTKDFMKWHLGNLKHGPTHRTDGPITGTASRRSDRKVTLQSDPSDHGRAKQGGHSPITGTHLVYQEGVEPASPSPSPAPLARRGPLPVISVLVGRGVTARAA